ncbi:MAG: hypothetical protein DWG76_02470 [Chloroflexi bacterium]|nr:hypothetical protein [Chloroflexota bacterium]
MNELQKALEGCLELITHESISIEEALEHYPQVVNEERPLLIAAQSLGTLKGIQPSAEYKKKARAQLVQRMGLHGAPARSASSSFEAASLWPKLRATAVMRTATSLAMVLLLFITTGTAFAQRALPGDFLYL